MSSSLLRFPHFAWHEHELEHTNNTYIASFKNKIGCIFKICNSFRFNKQKLLSSFILLQNSEAAMISGEPENETIYSENVENIVPIKRKKNQRQ